MGNVVTISSGPPVVGGLVDDGTLWEVKSGAVISDTTIDGAPMIGSISSGGGANIF